MMQPIDRPEQAIQQQQFEILQQLEDWLEMPMLVLSFAWLVLFIVELTQGLTPLLETLSLAIWVVFILEFLLKLLLAPSKIAYFKANWLTAIALFLPALRTLRIVRFVRFLRTTSAVRGLQLLRVLTRTNRSMRLLASSFQRRGFGYVLLLTTIVIFAGAAGMYAFERENPTPGFTTYSSALWWTAMLMTTMGSDYLPQTLEGRILFFLLALYAFAMFGYVTATLATFFIGQDADDDEAELAGAKSIEALRHEIIALRTEIQQLKQRDRSP